MAGDVLWPRAAEILSPRRRRCLWAETGLRAELWFDLSRAIAAILRRAPKVQRLVEDQALGIQGMDAATVQDLVRLRPGEPPEAGDMVIRVLMSRAPAVIPMLKDIAMVGRDSVEKPAMRQAIEREMDRVLEHMEDTGGFAHAIGGAGLGHATDEVRRVITLLREAERNST